MSTIRANVRGSSPLSSDIVRSILAVGGVDVTGHGGDSVIVLVEPKDGDWSEARLAGAPIVLVRAAVDDDALVDGVRRGADAVIELAAATTDVVDAVRAVAAGGALFSPRQASVVIQAFRRSSAGDGAIRLTPRERDILRSIESGHSVKQTARHLGISPKTVENLQSRLFRKLDVRNRAQAIAVAHRSGLLDDTREARIM